MHIPETYMQLCMCYHALCDYATRQPMMLAYQLIYEKGANLCLRMQLSGKMSVHTIWNVSGGCFLDLHVDLSKNVASL